VHVVVEDAQTGIARLEAILKNAGVANFEIRTGEPSLEDIFIASVSGAA
jgi:hypothetical protein